MNNEIFNTEIITSKSNSTIVKIGKLANKKAREEEKMFVCNGIKLFEESFNFNAKILYIVLKNSCNFDKKIIEKIKIAEEKNARILCVTDQVFDKITEEKSPQGIITVCQYLPNIKPFFTNVENNLENEKIMIFESVRDPGNVGTIIRNAAAFGIDRIILSSDCADVYSSKVVRAAMGAIFKVKIDLVDDVCVTFEALRKAGKRVLSATLSENALVLTKNTLSKDDVIIIGNEGHGVSPKTIESSDSSVFIPICENTESLNAAIASVIFMWELTK